MDSGTSYFIEAVWGVSASDVYAVGQHELILHYDGIEWTPVSIDSESSLIFKDVWASSSSDVFAAGGYGLILHWDGAEWSDIGPAFYSSFESIWGNAADDVFAAAENGSIWYYSDAEWSPMNSGSAMELNAIWGSDADNIYAAGASGTILHLDGSAWSSMDSGTSDHLKAVWGTSSNDVFAVGIGGTILHYPELEPSPIISSIQPDEGNPGETLEVTITGQDFSQVTDVSFDDEDIDLYSFTINDDTQITANVAIDVDATLGAKDIWLTADNDFFKETGLFTVTAGTPLPVIDVISPNECSQGETLDVIITGQYLDDLNNECNVSFGTGITVNSCSGDSETQITTNITVDDDALLGPRDVVVTINSGTLTVSESILVLPPPDYGGGGCGASTNVATTADIASSWGIIGLLGVAGIYAGRKRKN
jgi:hypothetical protein